MSEVQNEVVAGSETVAVAEVRHHVSRKDFLKACLASNSAAEVAKLTGLKTASILARRTKLKAEMGGNLPEFKRGGGRKLDAKGLAELNAMVAEAKAAKAKAESTASPEANEVADAIGG